jgi:Pyruvate/2-oxoacid:ferredoxin oxidoreductase delta subunit
LRIDKEKCAGCGQCGEYCTIGNITSRRRDARTGRVYYEIDEDECVDCGVCLRAGVCSTEALHMPDYDYPRVLRSQFSDPLVVHPKTNVPGRGTEEMKTIEVTGRIKRGFVGIACEMGRPTVGARFADVEKVAMALAKLGVEFEPANPCTQVMADPKKGTIKDEVKNEKVLSAIIEMVVPLAEAKAVLATIREVAGEVGCVFSVDLICPLTEDGSVPTVAILEELGWQVPPNGKVNNGLGRPLAAEVQQ